MLNQELKKTALNIHEKAKNRYNETYETTIKLCQALYDERKESLVLIRSIETLVSSIANRPKDFDVTLEQIHTERKNFRDTEEYAEKAQSETVKSGVGGAVGLGAGAAGRFGAKRGDVGRNDLRHSVNRHCHFRALRRSGAEGGACMAGRRSAVGRRRGNRRRKCAFGAGRSNRLEHCRRFNGGNRARRRHPEQEDCRSGHGRGKEDHRRSCTFEGNQRKGRRSAGEDHDPAGCASGHVQK